MLLKDLLEVLQAAVHLVGDNESERYYEYGIGMNVPSELLELEVAEVIPNFENTGYTRVRVNGNIDTEEPDYKRMNRTQLEEAYRAAKEKYGIPDYVFEEPKDENEMPPVEEIEVEE